MLSTLCITGKKTKTFLKTHDFTYVRISLHIRMHSSLRTYVSNHAIWRGWIGWSRRGGGIQKRPSFQIVFFVTATGFKPVTGWSVVSYSIQLSYGAIPVYCSFVLTGAKIRTFFENASVLLKLFSKNYSTKRELNSCQPSVKPTFQSLDGEL